MKKCFVRILSKYDDLNSEEVYVLYTVWFLGEFKNKGVTRREVQREIFKDTQIISGVAKLFDDFEMYGESFESEAVSNTIDDLVKLGALKKCKGKIKLNCKEVLENGR